MLEHEVAAGREPTVVDGQVFVTEDHARGVVFKDLPDGRKRLVKQEGDTAWLERMRAEDMAEIEQGLVAERGRPNP